MARSIPSLIVVVLAILAWSSGASAQTPQSTVLFPSDCEHESAEPHSIVVTCADGNFRIRSIRWSSWMATSATGRGIARVNTCAPNCAEGRNASYRAVTVRLWRPLLCTGTGVSQFSHLTYRFTRERPRDLPASGTQLFRCADPQWGRLTAARRARAAPRTWAR